MAAQRDQELQKLAEKHRIAFRPPVASKDQWPSRYRTTFDNITRLGAHTFENFVASIEPLAGQQPWRDKTKRRAAWLARRAGELVPQQLNEAGWRFNLENHVFLRFSMEIACPGCRARLWKSALEAGVDSSNKIARELENRRKIRQICRCPPEKRPQDYYDHGTSLLFDSRVQEVVLHDALLRDELPKQEPDRIYGLRETANFKKLFSTPMLRSSNPQGKSIGEYVRSCPFKKISDPLLFPFLILEAKSDKSSKGFDDIRIQTALPTLALLKLQEDLARQVDDEQLDGGPLAWFFASRGDAWRVYGCYVTEDNPVRYDIMQLWDGSILSNDKALQLLLIVDYIFDWARDVYRPSILLQLKSLASLDPYDMISASHDSDIHSMRRKISSWIQPPQDIRNLTSKESHPNQHSSRLEPTSDHEPRLLALARGMDSDELSTFRSPTASTTRMSGLHLTEANTRSLLQWGGVKDYNNKISRKACRTLINFITQWDEVLLLSYSDLLNFESSWTGSSSTVDEPLENAEVADTYVLLEYAVYMDVSWRIVREITYLAISKGAFEVLVEYADFSKKHNGIDSISEIPRPCSTGALEEVVRCLRSGSVHQTFSAAVLCSCFALFPLPERERPVRAPPMLALGLAKLPHSRLRGIVTEYHAFGIPQMPEDNVSRVSRSKRQRVEESSRELENESFQPDRSFIRISETRDDISANPGHDLKTCDRCCRLGADANPYSEAEKSPFTESGMALVTALAFHEDRDGSHEFCLFAQEIPEDVHKSKGGVFHYERAMCKILEKVLQSGKVYHTIQHPLPRAFAKANNHYEVRWNSAVWNLPLPMRPLTNDQRRVFDQWLEQMCGGGISLWEHETKDTWNSLQMSLFLLKASQSWDQVTETVENHREEVKESMERNARIRGLRKVNGIFDMRARLYALYADKAREEDEKRKAAGENVEEKPYIPSQQRTSENKLHWRDADVSQYGGCTLNFLRT